MNIETNNTTERISWDITETNAVALAFIREREMDPFGSSVEMLRHAINKALPDNRRRQINTWVAVPEVKKRIEDLWLETIAAVKPEPVIVHVETQKPPDYTDMLERLDMPSLVAMLTAKLGAELSTLKPLLSALSHNGNGNGHTETGAPLRPPVSLLAAASSRPRRTRVLVVGCTNAEFQHINRASEENKIPVDLLYLDQDKRNPGKSIPISTDYVVALQHLSHPVSQAIQKTVPAGKFFFLREGGMTSAVQKLRDIGAFIPPRA